VRREPPERGGLSRGDPDDFENLITLCRPCHAVQHPDNEAFDDSRPDATLFPDPKAPKCVAEMRLPHHHECERCGDELPPPRNIIAHRTGTTDNADVNWDRDAFLERAVVTDEDRRPSYTPTV